MSMDLKVEIAFSRKPTETPSWSDVTEYVREELYIRRGRTTELEQPQAGECRFFLDNRDGRFDPNNESGPYYGEIKPLRKVRVSAKSSSETIWHPIFTGYVSNWQMTYLGRDAVVEATAIDGFKVLSLTRITGTFEQENTGDRIEAMLEAANWSLGDAWILESTSNGKLGQTTYLGPGKDNAISQGKSEIAETELDGVTALEHILDVAELEGGLFFIRRDGAAAFYNRHQVLYDAMIPGITLSANNPSSGLEDVYVTYSEEILYNRVTSSRTGGATYTAENGDSQLDYFVRSLDRRSFPYTTDEEAYQWAHFLCNKYAEPSLRIARARARVDADLISYMLIRLDLMATIVVKATPPGGAHISQLSALQGIVWRINKRGWYADLYLAPIDTTEYWIMSLSDLESETTLAL